MTTVTVGIRHHDESGQLHVRARALGVAAVRHAQPVVPLDGAEVGALAGGSRLHIPLPSPVATRAAPACSIGLAAETEREVINLLESGTIPAVGALDPLIDALSAKPRNGLGGPSTDIARSEEGRFGSAAADDVDAIAAIVMRRFGGQVRALGPLHSLGDFYCPVGREVIEAIGDAGNWFGDSPCWESDAMVGE